MREVAFLLIAATAALAPGCGMRVGGFGGSGASDASYESTAAVSPTTTSRISLASSKPVDAYVQLGGRIKTCWFNPTEPLLPDHVYRANVSPDGNKVQITIHEKMKLGRAGLSTYAIDFRQEGSGTVVTTENRKMPPELAAKMQYDIDRWKGGETDCNKVMPPVAAAVPQ
ncbi:MAG TPA: hypothetical protein VNJ31_07780 [Methyloceanibacter sp.]|nr:hypothetical protein [Methyloceanibacter sp.]